MQKVYMRSLPVILLVLLSGGGSGGAGYLLRSERQGEDHVRAVLQGEGHWREYSKGTKLLSSGREGSWVKVVLLQKEGYISALLLSTHPSARETEPDQRRGDRYQAERSAASVHLHERGRGSRTCAGRPEKAEHRGQDRLSRAREDGILHGQFRRSLAVHGGKHNEVFHGHFACSDCPVCPAVSSRGRVGAGRITGVSVSSAGSSDTSKKMWPKRSGSAVRSPRA